MALYLAGVGPFDQRERSGEWWWVVVGGATVPLDTLPTSASNQDV
jgi:hypothetical protein